MYTTIIWPCEAHASCIFNKAKSIKNKHNVNVSYFKFLFDLKLIVLYVLPYSTFEPITPFMYHYTNSLLTTKAWNGIYLDMFPDWSCHLVFVCYGVKFSSISPQKLQLTFLHPINSWFWCRFWLWSEARTILISESVVFGEPWRWCWVLTRASLENLSHKNRLQLNGDYNYDSRLEVGKWH